MDKGTKIRWAVLLTALAATLIAMFYPIDEGKSPTAMPSALPKPVISLTSVIAKASVEEDEPADLDPFAPRGWQAPPPAPALPAIASPVAAGPTVLAPPPGPPPLPFRFVGSLKDGSELLVYLARGDETMIARPGEVLEGTYKVNSVTTSQMELEHIPTGQKQALVFPVREN
ncbi:hypothetical protein [Duganella sp. BuS-21]|uniref:hypothetical protein n=1 Tax=Duganella sp. BuS-21 TaxID=2943848 RepID=UPI0035A73A7E